MQFHELPAQVIALIRHNTKARVLDLHLHTVAARSVAEVLIELAEGPPQHGMPDLAGPQEADLVNLARAFVKRRGLSIAILPDSKSVPGIPRRVLLPDAGARIEGPIFEE